MSLMDADDWAQMRADLASARGDNEVTITVLNRTTTPATQRVRIVGAGGQAVRVGNDETAETRGPVLVKGPADLDIQVGDEFAVAGVGYLVTFVDPQRRVRTSAEAKVRQ